MSTSVNVATATQRPLPPYQAKGNGAQSIASIATRAELETLIKRKDHTGSREYWITPDLAKWLLQHNTGNRRFSRGRCDRYVRILRNDMWVNTGEPIIVADDGTLNEGQHRLTAIVETNITVPYDIRFGISRIAFKATGTGATRSVGDVLGIAANDPIYANTRAAAARLLICYEMGLPGSLHTQLQPGEIADAALKWEDKLKFASELCVSLGGKHGMNIRNAAAVAFCTLARLARNQSTVEEFMEIVATGLVTDKSNPARVLYDRLRNDDGHQGVGRNANMERLALFIKAWNAWLNGDAFNKGGLRWRSAGPQAEPFPELKGARLG